MELAGPSLEALGTAPGEHPTPRDLGAVEGSVVLRLARLPRERSVLADTVILESVTTTTKVIANDNCSARGGLRYHHPVLPGRPD